jgi:drug/metabolite transporter (DMT)-like permease
MASFAGNSLLCRAALRQTAIDPWSFTLARIAAGALTLAALAAFRSRGAGPEGKPPAGSWPSALALFAYAAGFSGAYVSLPAGTGALLLFGAVQATMIVWGLRSGERLRFLQALGLALALTGLVTLTLPGLAAPHPLGAAAMLTAGVAWGVYSLRGRGSKNPIQATAGNFLRACLPAALLWVALLARAHYDPLGLAYAVLSGAITSGLGYAVWYTVLPALSATRAASVQLSVPVLAALGGTVLLAEPLTWRLAVASGLVLGGIALSTGSWLSLGPGRRGRSRTEPSVSERSEFARPARRATRRPPN